MKVLFTRLLYYKRGSDTLNKLGDASQRLLTAIPDFITFPSVF